MSRRFHVDAVHGGEIALDAAQARHARQVLRLAVGDEAELFDATGTTAVGRISRCDADNVTVLVQAADVRHSLDAAFALHVAAAVPKGPRADWMVEKLSELGVGRLTPLAAARSVALPEGVGKRERWMRLAAESAKQSRRAGVMRIEPLTPVQAVLAAGGPMCVASTEPGAQPIVAAWPALRLAGSLTILVGPEGGWTPSELAAFESDGVFRVRLVAPILRIETAALAAAAILLTLAADSHN